MFAITSRKKGFVFKKQLFKSEELYLIADLVFDGKVKFVNKKFGPLYKINNNIDAQIEMVRYRIYANDIDFLNNYIDIIDWEDLTTILCSQIPYYAIENIERLDKKQVLFYFFFNDKKIYDKLIKSLDR